MKLKLIFFFGVLFFSETVFSSEPLHVYSKSGNIFLYSTEKNLSEQLTYSGYNKYPVLSPDHQWVAFVGRSTEIIPKNCADQGNTDTQYGETVRIMNLKDKKAHQIVKNNFDCDNPEKMILDPSELKFSPDSKTIYFETYAWVTSGAIHAVNVDGTNVRFVTDGNEYRVVMKGHYKSDLIVNQHRYRVKGGIPLGSYDWDWLFTPEGKQIKLYRKE